jgi:hypothetical protein
MIYNFAFVLSARAGLLATKNASAVIYNNIPKGLQDIDSEFGQKITKGMIDVFKRKTSGKTFYREEIIDPKARDALVRAVETRTALERAAETRAAEARAAETRAAEKRAAETRANAMMEELLAEEVKKKLGIKNEAERKANAAAEAQLARNPCPAPAHGF